MPYPFCHCEPFAFCHSERSEESQHTAQDKLREAISEVVGEDEIASVVLGDLAMTGDPDCVGVTHLSEQDQRGATAVTTLAVP